MSGGAHTSPGGRPYRQNGQKGTRGRGPARRALTAREIALEALLRVEEGGYSNLVLDHALARAHHCSALDAAFATQLFYGVLERGITLDAMLSHFSKKPVDSLSPIARMCLRMGLYQIHYMDKVPDSAAVNESVNLVKNSRERQAAGYVNGVLRAVLRSPDLDGLLHAGDPAVRLSLTMSAPLWLVNHLCASYGEDCAQALLSACIGRPPLHLRANPLRADAQQLCERLAAEGIQSEPSAECPGAVTVQKGTGSLERLDAYREGLFHVQDLASQYCCMALDPRPGERLLDCCAAPGGKSFTLAERMDNQGELVAMDLYASKIGLIRDGAARLGLTCIRSVVGDASQPERELGIFDKICCDVPCSGLGIIRRKPEIRYKNVAILDKLPEMQYRILCINANRLRAGGRLVYSTCTLNPAENEAVIGRFLSEHPDFAPAEVLPQLVRRAGEEGHHITLFPHIHHTDGFFIAAVTKRVRV